MHEDSYELCYVRFWHKADIATPHSDIAQRLQCGSRYPFMSGLRRAPASPIAGNEVPNSNLETGAGA